MNKIRSNHRFCEVLFCICLLFLLPSVSLFAQTQRISVNLNNVTLEQAISEIELKSGYNFLYNTSLVSPKEVVSVTKNNATLRDILSEMLQNTEISFQIVDKQIILTPKGLKQETTTDQTEGNTSPISSSSSVSSSSGRENPQEFSISGIIVDNNNEPLPGAVVSVKDNAGKYAMTDNAGQFNLKDISPNATIVVTFIGFETQEVAANGRAVINVRLEEESGETLEVAVVTGYQTLSRDRVTGSFGTITATALENKLQPDLKSILEGQVSGLTIDKDGKLEIRGLSTFTASSSPLIVVDGFPIDATMNDDYFSDKDGTFDLINPENIESVTVLKDGVAASIYGSRAANGVIVVTTNKGAKGKPVVSYRGTFGVSQKPDLHTLNRSSSTDYIDAEIDFFNINPNNAAFRQTANTNLSRVLYLLREVRDGNISQSAADGEINQLRNVDFLAELEKHVFRPKLSHQHNVSISGGNDVQTYNIAANYMRTREDMIHSNNDRFTLDARNEWKLNKYVTASASINLARTTSESPIQKIKELTDFFYNLDFQPYTRIKDENGNNAAIWGQSTFLLSEYDQYDNMKDTEYFLLNDLDKQTVKTNDFQSRVTAQLRVNILEGLTGEVGGNWQRGSYKYSQVYDSDSYYLKKLYNNTVSKTDPANHYIPNGSMVDERRNINDSWTFRAQLNYNRGFKDNKHRINLLAGNEIRRSTFDNNTYATRFGYNSKAGSFIPVNIKDLQSNAYRSDMLVSTSLTSIVNAGSYALRDNRFVSWYGNGSYEFDSKYIISGSIRLDLTNFFGTDSKYRYKPLWSVGGTWKLSEESFFDIPIVNRLNIRGSYGINGNISLNEGPFMILSVGSYDPTTEGVSYGISSPPNNQLRWEKTQITNAGLDLAMLNNRINLSFDYYYKYTTDVLAPYSLDATKGFSSVNMNVGSIRNQGIEIMLSSKIIQSGKFEWNASYLTSFNQSKVLTYEVNRLYDSQYATATPINVEGYPVLGLWGYHSAHTDNMGRSMIYNAKGEIISIDDATTDDVFYMGSSRPKWDMSLTNKLSYGNWDLSFMFIAKLGHVYRSSAFYGYNFQNVHVKDRWRGPEDTGKTHYPGLWAGSRSTFFLDAFVEKASYAKLRDITLSYTIDKKFTDKLGIGSAKVYIQGRNLFIIKGKNTDIDPETLEYNYTGSAGTNTEQQYNGLPVPRELYVGLQLSF